MKFWEAFMNKNISIESVTQSGLCTGCGLCQAMFPDRVTIQLNDDGYLRPSVKLAINDDELKQFNEVCPGIILRHEAGGAEYDPLWGPLIGVRTGYAIDQQTRYAGSSGGVLSALLIYLLDTRQVDFVAHIKASCDDPLGNEIAISRTREDVLAGAGSRYAPSAPLATLGELLAQPEQFAFVGKPCDIAALRSYERLNPQVTEKIPFMLSFMCAGIPSRKGTIEILNKFGVEPKQVKSFTYRGNGWPGKTTAITQDGKTYETDYSTSWGTVLNRHLQFRCKICPDGTGEFADIVGADAWYGKDGYPDFAEREGRSLILSRTAKGEVLVKNASAEQAITAEFLPIEEISKMQPYQMQRKQMIFSRIMALKLLRSPAPDYINFSLIRTAATASLKENIRSFLGTIRRVRF